jgi:hypothetical protein
MAERSSGVRDMGDLVSGCVFKAEDSAKTPNRASDTIEKTRRGVLEKLGDGEKIEENRSADDTD